MLKQFYKYSTNFSKINIVNRKISYQKKLINCKLNKKVENSIKNFNMRLIACIFYIFPLSDSIRRLRNVANHYPSNLLAYQICAYPHFVIFYTTFSMLTTFIIFQKYILQNNKMNRYLREHGLLANIFDIGSIYLYNLTFVTHPLFRWSFLHSFIDIFLYSVSLIFISYSIIAALMMKIPRFPAFLEKIVKEFRNMFQMY